MVKSVPICGCENSKRWRGAEEVGGGEWQAVRRRERITKVKRVTFATRGKVGGEEDAEAEAEEEAEQGAAKRAGFEGRPCSSKEGARTLTLWR